MPVARGLVVLATTLCIVWAAACRPHTNLLNLIPSPVGTRQALGTLAAEISAGKDTATVVRGDSFWTAVVVSTRPPLSDTSLGVRVTYGRIAAIENLSVVWAQPEISRNFITWSFASPRELRWASADSIYYEIKSWEAFPNEAQRRANSINGTRSLWGMVLGLAQYGGGGAAVVAGASSSVDQGVSLGGGLASIVATVLRSVVNSDNMLKRQKACESLWATKAQISRIASDYRTAKERNDEPGVTRALAAFDSYKQSVEPVYRDCISRV